MTAAFESELRRSPTGSSSRRSAGEQIEAFVSRGGETEVRVYEGDVEHFVSAQSEGIGIRVIVGGRTGFAYAARSTPTPIADVLAQARDNVQFGTVDEYAALAEPDGVPVTEQPLWNDELAAYPTDDKIDLAKQLEKLTSGIDHRIRVDDSNYADAYGESAVATTTGIRMSGRENGCYVSVSTLADEGEGDDAETQTGFGFSVGRSPDEFDLERAAKEAADRATRLLGATKPASKRLTVVLDPFVTAQFLGVISSTLNGEAVVKGRVAVPRAPRRAGGLPARHDDRRPDEPEGLHGHRRRRRGSRGAAQRAHRGRRAAAVRAQLVLGPPGGDGVDGQRDPGGFAGTPGVGCLALSLVPGTRTQEELIADIDDGLLVQRCRACTRASTRSAATSPPARPGLLITNGAVGAPVREFTIASTLQRMLLDIVEVGGDLDWLPMRAAGMSLVISDVTMSGA